MKVFTMRLATGTKRQQFNSLVNDEAIHYAMWRASCTKNEQSSSLAFNETIH